MGPLRTQDVQCPPERSRRAQRHGRRSPSRMRHTQLPRILATASLCLLMDTRLRDWEERSPGETCYAVRAGPEVDDFVSRSHPAHALSLNALACRDAFAEVSNVVVVDDERPSQHGLEGAGEAALRTPREVVLEVAALAPLRDSGDVI